MIKMCVLYFYFGRDNVSFRPWTVFLAISVAVR